MSVGVRHDRDARLDREADVLVLQVESVREAIRLQGRTGLRARLEQALEVDGVGRPPVDQAPRRMADRRDMRVLDCGESPGRQLLP